METRAPLLPFNLPGSVGVGALLGVFFVTSRLLPLPIGFAAAIFGGALAMLLILSGLGKATAGADGVYWETGFRRRFIPGTRIRRVVYKARPTGGVSSIELQLVDSTRVLLIPLVAVPDDSGHFLERLLDGLREPVTSDRHHHVDVSLTKHEEPPEGGYRTPPLSRPDLWTLAYDPRAEPRSRLLALGSLASTITPEERRGLLPLADATAHPQVKRVLLALHAEAPETEVAKLVNEGKRRPIALR